MRDRSASDSSASPASISRWACGYDSCWRLRTMARSARRIEYRTVGIDVDRPEQRLPIDTGEQARGSFVENDGMEWRTFVGREHRRAACTRREIERTVRSHERRDIGNGVPDSVATRRALRRVRLVEVETSLGVDRHERDVAPVGHIAHGRAGGYERAPPRRGIGFVLGRLVEALSGCATRPEWPRTKPTTDCRRPPV